MANRADLSLRCKKTKMCKFFMSNACQRGSSCAYAHSQAELRATPNLRCTILCPKMLAGKVCAVASCQFAHSARELKKFPGDHLPGAEADDAVAVAKLTETMIRQLNDNHNVTDMAQNFLRLKQAQGAIQHALASLEGRLMDSAKGPSCSTRTPGSLSQQSTSSELNVELLSDPEYVTESVLDDPVSCSQPQETTSWGQLGSACGLGCQEQAYSKAEAGGFGRQISQYPDQADVPGDCGLERQVSTQSESMLAQSNLSMQTTAFGPVFGRQVSDFGTVFGRQVSYATPPSYSPGEGDDMYAPLGLCIKNTFLTIEEGDQESKRTASCRSQSAPARCVQFAPSRTKADKSDASFFGSEPVQQMDSTQVPNTMPRGPLPVGEVSLAQSGPVLLGRATKKYLTVKGSRARQPAGKAVLVF